MPVSKGTSLLLVAMAVQRCIFDCFQESQEKNIQILHMRGWCHVHLLVPVKHLFLVVLSVPKPPEQHLYLWSWCLTSVYKMLRELHTEEIHSAKQCLKLRNLSAAVQAVSWIL